MLKKRRGQSLLEYIIILTAIVTAIILGLKLFVDKSKDSGLGKLLNQAGSTIQNASSRVGNITQ